MNVPPEVSRAVEAREKIVEALALQDSVRLRMVVKSAAQTQWSNQSLAASGLPVVFRDPVLAHQLDGATQALTQGALQKWRSAYSGSHRSLGHPFAGQTGTTFLQQVSELEGWLRSVDSVQQEVPTRVYRALAFKLVVHRFFSWHLLDGVEMEDLAAVCGDPAHRPILARALSAATRRAGVKRRVEQDAAAPEAGDPEQVLQSSASSNTVVVTGSVQPPPPCPPLPPRTHIIESGPC